jgi:hypothetical protein
MKYNNYAMREWHLEHVEKVILRYIIGMPQNASYFKKRIYKKHYGTAARCVKQIEYDIRHGVTKTEVMEIIGKIRIDIRHADLLRSNPEVMTRLDELEQSFTGANEAEIPSRC